MSVRGENFRNDAALSCAFGATVDAATFVSATMLTCVSPAGSSATYVDVEIANNGVDFTSTRVSFWYTDPLVVTALEPIRGVVTGGTRVEFAVDPFVETANGFLSCFFGGVEVDGERTRPDRVACETPARTAGAVAVFLSYNHVDKFAAGTYTYIAVPTVISAVPSYALADVGNQVLTVRGTNFKNTPELACVFNEREHLVPPTFVSATRLLCNVPAPVEATDVSLSVTVNAVDFSAPIIVPIVDLPHALSIRPVTGTATGGTEVTITGRMFASSGMYCRFGTLSPVAATASSTSHVTCTTPAYATGGTIDIELSTNNHDYTSNNMMFEYVTPVTVTSLTPESAFQGGGVLVTVYGSNFGPFPMCQFGSEPAEFGIKESETRIVCESPLLTPGSHAVEVSANLGEDFTSFGVSFLALMSPIVFDVVPNVGLKTGGEEIIVIGVNFVDLPTLTCRFEFTPVAATFINSTALSCFAPAYFTGSFPLEISLNGVDYTSNDLQYTFEAWPTILGINPLTGSQSGGTEITIRGQDFVEDLITCSFYALNRIDSLAQYISSTAMMCVSPASNVTGLVRIDMLIPDKGSVEDRFFRFYEGAPDIQRVFPLLGSSYGNTTVSVYGSGFEDQKTMRCKFGPEEPQIAEWVSDEWIVCRSPQIAPLTIQQVIDLAISRNGVDYDEVVDFRFYADPVVDSILPVSGPLIGGTEVTVVGSGFVDDGYIRCKFGDLEVTGVATSSTQILCTTPSQLTTGPVAFEMSLNEGVDYLYEGPTPAAAENFPVSSCGLLFEYVETVVVREIVPVRGSDVGGTAVTLVGEHFTADAACRFGLTNGHQPAANVVSDTMVVCTSPAHATGRLTVEVTVNDQDFTSNLRQFTYVPDWDVVRVEPQYASELTTPTVSVRGSAFVPSNLLLCRPEHTFVPVLATYVSPSVVECDISGAPAGLPFAIEVTNNGVDYTSADVLFQFVPEPTIAALVPVLGPTSGGSRVTLTGSDLDGGTGAAVQCRFGDGTAADSMVWAVTSSATQVVCVSPPLALGTYAVSLSVNERYSWSLSTADFRAYATPLVAALEPPLGAVSGGTSVTVTGHNFIVDPLVSCLFGTDLKVTGSVESDTRMVCISPVVTDADVGHVQLQVAMNGEDFTSNDVAFRYVLDAGVTSVVPTTTTANSPPAPITVYGANFVDSALLRCQFGTFPGVEAAWISAQEVQCDSPATASVAEVVVIEVSNNDADVTSNAVSFSFTDLPDVTVLSPSSGPWGAPILVESTAVDFGLSDYMCCQFGTIVVPVLEVVSANQVLCRAPVQLDRSSLVDVAVRVASNCHIFSDTSADFTTVNPMGVAYEAEPAFGAVEGGQTVTLTGDHFANTEPGNIRCRFGDAVSTAATFVSDTRIKCTAPDSGGVDGWVDLEVAMNGNDFSKQHVRYRYYTREAIDGGEPGSLPLHLPGRVATVVGGPFIDTHLLSCLITDGGFLVDQRAPVEYVSSSKVVCQIPRVQVVTEATLSVSNDDFSWSDASPFAFYDLLSVSLSTIELETKLEMASNRLTVVGSGFRPDLRMRCRIGESVVVPEAGEVTTTSVVCRTPSLLAADAIPLEISLDGVHFTSDGLTFNLEPCPAGAWCDGNSTFACDQGHWCPFERMAGMYECQPGLQQNITGQTECDACPPGFMCPGFAHTLDDIGCDPGMLCSLDESGLRFGRSCPGGIVCPGNTQVAEVMNTTVPEENRPLVCPDTRYCATGVSVLESVEGQWNTPQDCFASYSCPVGPGVGPDDCGAGYAGQPTASCPTGQWQPEGQGPCPEGFFCANAEAIQICRAGTYCPGIGNSVETDCPSGTYGPVEGLGACYECDIGYYCPSLAMTSAVPCDAGKVCPTTSIDFPSLLCPAGYYCPAGTGTTDPAVVSDSFGSPLPCPAGTYCLDGVVDIEVVKDGVIVFEVIKDDFSYPQPCPAGRACGVATRSPTAATLCPAGQYSYAGSVSCSIVDPGHYSPAGGSGFQTPCPADSWQDEAGQSSCKPCPSGFECVELGMTEPSPCPNGSYREHGQDGVNCIPCPAGTHLPLGSPGVNRDSCIDCPAGYICRVSGLADIVPGEPPCENCPEGKYCPAGTNPTSILDTDCPRGYVCGRNVDDQSRFDMPCPAGFFCPAGTKLSALDDVLFVCPAGSYCVEGTVNPEECPEGSTSEKRAESIEDCLTVGVVIDSTFPLESNGRRRDRARNTSASSTSRPTVTMSDPAADGFDDGRVRLMGQQHPPSAQFPGGEVRFHVAQYTVPEDTSLLEDTLGFRELIFDFRSLHPDMQYEEHFVLEIFEGEEVVEDMKMDLPTSFVNDLKLGRPGLFILRLIPLVPTSFRVRLATMTERFVGQKSALASTVSVRDRRTLRASAGEDKMVAAIVHKDVDFVLPLNAPDSLETSLLIQYLNATTDAPEQYEAVEPPEPSDFWVQGREMYGLPYFPYFSNCDGYDSTVPVFEVLENDECTLVPVDDTVPVDRFQPTRRSVSDVCDITLTCSYEENVERETLLRWFEASEGDVLFYLTREPVTAEELLQQDQFFVSVTKLIGVQVETATHSSTESVPTEFVLLIRYYQVTKEVKNIIQSTITFGAYRSPDDLRVEASLQSGNQTTYFTAEEAEAATAVDPFFSASSVSGRLPIKYTLRVVYEPMQYFDVINAFAFNISVYILMYVLFGFLCIIAIMVFVFAHRLVIFIAVSIDRWRHKETVQGRRRKVRVSLRLFRQSGLPIIWGAFLGMPSIAFVLYPISQVVQLVRPIVVSTGGIAFTEEQLDLVVGGRTGVAFAIAGCLTILLLATVLIPQQRPRSRRPPPDRLQNSILLDTCPFLSADMLSRVRKGEFLRRSVEVGPDGNLILTRHDMDRAAEAKAAEIERDAVRAQGGPGVGGFDDLDHLKEANDSTLGLSSLEQTSVVGGSEHHFDSVSVVEKSAFGERLVQMQEQLDLEALLDYEDQCKLDDEFTRHVESRVNAQRAHFVFISFGVLPLLLTVMEFSYSPVFSNNVILSLVLLYVLKMFVERRVLHYVGDVLQTYHIMSAYSTVEFVITLGAEANLVLFILYYVMALWLEIIERVYIDPIAKRFQRWLPGAVHRGKAKLRRMRGLAALEEADEKDEEKESRATILENEMLEDLAVYSANTIALVLGPSVMLYMIIWNQELRITEGYGVRADELWYYFAFQATVLFSQSFANVFIHHFQELMWGYGISNYYRSCVHRFKTRLHRWKSYDNVKHAGSHFEPVMKSLDIAAFSSQTYFVWALYTTAYMFVVFGISMMLRASYNPFADPLALVMALLAALLVFLSFKLSMLAARYLGIWGRGASSSWYPLPEENGKDSQQWWIGEATVDAMCQTEFVDIVNASEMSRSELKDNYEEAMTDEAFRMEFVLREKKWIQEHGLDGTEEIGIGATADALDRLPSDDEDEDYRHFNYDAGLASGAFSGADTILAELNDLKMRQTFEAGAGKRHDAARGDHGRAAMDPTAGFDDMEFYHDDAGHEEQGEEVLRELGQLVLDNEMMQAHTDFDEAAADDADGDAYGDAMAALMADEVARLASDAAGDQAAAGGSGKDGGDGRDGDDDDDYFAAAVVNDAPFEFEDDAYDVYGDDFDGQFDADEIAKAIPVAHTQSGILQNLPEAVRRPTGMLDPVERVDDEE